MQPMRVIVTGAGGRLGRAVMARMQEAGLDVVGVDRLAPMSQGRTIVADLCDLGQVCGALAGADAVIHLGAIPAPVGFAPEVVFRNNILGQFNVCEAAAILGIRRIVSASSVSALGFPWQHRWPEPFYLPIDEAHPLLPQDAYGLSKAAGEEIAAAQGAARRASAFQRSLMPTVTAVSSTASEPIPATSRVCCGPTSIFATPWRRVCSPSRCPSRAINRFLSWPTIPLRS